MPAIKHVVMVLSVCVGVVSSAPVGLFPSIPIQGECVTLCKFAFKSTHAYSDATIQCS